MCKLAGVFFLVKLPEFRKEIMLAVQNVAVDVMLEWDLVPTACYGSHLKNGTRGSSFESMMHHGKGTDSKSALDGRRLVQE